MPFQEVKWVSKFILMCVIMGANTVWSEEIDPFLWLEDIEGEAALTWVEERNQASLAVLEKFPQFKKLYDKNLAVYDSQDRIPYPTIRGEYFYNFWKDEKNERGIWRRTTAEKYQSEQPEWELLLDLDALARTEKESWVWKGANCLPPAYDRCLVSLSRGGADAVVIREFDLPSRSFVKDGFNIAESKTGASFVDQDTLLIASDFGPGTMTNSGYARQVKKWKRGTELADAKLIYEGTSDDIGLFPTVYQSDDQVYSLLFRALTFFDYEVLWFRDGQLLPLDIPADASVEALFDHQLLISLATDWERDDKTWPQGSLVSIDINDLVRNEGTVISVVEPDSRSAISEVGRTRDLLLVNRMVDVRSRLEAYSLIEGKWQRRSIDAPQMGQISLTSASEDSNFFFFSYQDFLTPTSLFQAEGLSKPQAAKALPSFFDGTPYEVSQEFVQSSDGTRVPYFRVSGKDLKLDGKNKTLIYAYGGFEISQKPSYSATIGMDWLDEGGVFILANIRGGGEYGPAWHLAAQRENRQKSYDDFYAIAEDLIKKGVTTPDHLGIRGGSGGGLLVAMLFIQRPELFGAVVCQVPLLDMQRYHKLLAGASWVAEYGDPENPDDWAFLKNYSPYHNLDSSKNYPRVFFTTSTRDDRVHPAHARKMVAKMNEMGIENYYFENTEGGHGGAANNQQQARVQALIYTYLLNELE